jgi:hypothetical protein
MCKCRKEEREFGNLGTMGSMKNNNGRTAKVLRKREWKGESDNSKI